MDAKYFGDGEIERLLTVSTAKANAARNAALAGAPFTAEMQFVTVNDTKYGGSGGSYAVFAGGNQSQFTDAAFKMFLDYDGDGGEFGDVSVGADTSSIADSAVYASIDAGDPSRMILIAINRTNQPLNTGLAVTSDSRFDRAEVFQLTSASASPVQAADIPITLVNAFQYTMPAYSVSTLVLHTAPSLAGDFDGDGDVDGRDFLVWQRDPSVGDLADWRGNYGAGSLSASVAVPEPLTWLLVVSGAMLFGGNSRFSGRCQHGFC